jgi:SAM-dependent methyltransferase
MAYRRTVTQRIADAVGVRISWIGEYFGSARLIYNVLTLRNFHRVAVYSAPGVATTLRTLFPGARTVLDVGSGTGAYAAELKRAGYEVVALERSAAGRKMAIKQGVDCRPFDLLSTPPCEINAQFDVAYCFEVAEHLPEALAARLVEFIAGTTSDVLFTAAAPGQLGLGHVNCQPKEYWISHFRNVRFEYCEVQTKHAVHVLRDQGVIYWLINNMMIFRRVHS